MSKTRWDRVRISEVCDLIVDCLNRTAPTVEGPTPYKMVRTSNIRNGRINLLDVKFAVKEVYDKWTRRAVPQKNDVILTREAPLGEVGIIRDNSKIFLGQRLVMYRTNPDKLLPQFLFYSLMSHDLQEQIQAFGSGSTVAHMRVPDTKKLELNLPSIEIQRKIVGVLGTLDDLYECNLNRIRVLEELAKSFYDEWFVNFRYPGHENAEITETTYGPTPKGWEWKRIGDAFEFAYGKALKRADRIPGDFPVYGSSGVVGSHKTYLVEGPTIIVGRKGNVGSVYWSHDNCYPIDTVFYIKGNVSLYYIYFNLQHQNFINSDAAVPGLSRRQAYNLPILIPKQSILKLFEDLIKPVFEQKHSLEKENEKLCRIRDLLLPKVISGEIDVGELDVSV